MARFFFGDFHAYHDLVIFLVVQSLHFEIHFKDDDAGLLITGNFEEIYVLLRFICKIILIENVLCDRTKKKNLQV